MIASEAETLRAAAETDLPALVGLWEELFDFHAACDPYLRRSDQGRDIFARFIQRRRPLRGGTCGGACSPRRSRAHAGRTPSLTA